MNLNDKVNTQTTTTGTSTTGKTTCSGWNTTYSVPQQGWECPRCGRINAPWMSQCVCSRGYWYPTWTSDHVYVGDKPEWWKEVTCHDDNIMNNPTTYQVGGSDYKVNDTYVNVSGTQSNKVDPNVTAWSCTNPDIAVNDFTTYRTDVPKTYTTIANSINNLQKQLNELKETK